MLKNIALCLILILSIASSKVFAENGVDLEDIATRNATARFETMVKKVGITKNVEKIREKVLPKMIEREVDRLIRVASNNNSWRMKVLINHYRYGIKSAELAPYGRFYHVTSSFRHYRTGKPNFVRVQNGIPFMLPSRREVSRAKNPRIEYLRLYANRYAQSYNLGLKGWEMGNRLPFYDRKLRASYHLRY